MTRFLRVIRTLAVGHALTLAALGGCDADSTDCPDGSETCRCTTDYKCLEGLTCLSDRCVDVFWTPPEATDDDDTSPGGRGDDESVDNVDACEDWVAELSSSECGGADWSQLAGCQAYADVTCDLAGQGFFDCLTENTMCTVGVPDVSGWTQCASLGTCE
jgi:hypothetical protein